MGKFVSPFLMAWMCFPPIVVAHNTLSIVCTSPGNLEILLSNTDTVMCLQFDLRSSHNITLSDPSAETRIQSTSWVLATYQPNDSTLNVAIVNVKQEYFSAGTGSLIHLRYISSGGIPIFSFRFTNVLATNVSDDSIGVSAIGLTWTNPDVNSIPPLVSLDQNYPNPFNPTTMISFFVYEDSYISLKIYDMTGREVGTIVNEFLSPGQYSKPWRPEALPSGTYYYRLASKNYSITKKMVFLK